MIGARLWTGRAILDPLINAPAPAELRRLERRGIRRKRDKVPMARLGAGSRRAGAVEGREPQELCDYDLDQNVDEEAPSELSAHRSAAEDPAAAAELPVVIQLLESTERQMMMISGQFQAQMGENDQQSAASGKAINERQQQGRYCHLPFLHAHQGDMLRNVGTRLIDLIPKKIYDTKRALQVMDEDGDKRWISIDPTLETPVEEMKQEKDDEEAIRLAFNPNLGEYECVSDPRP